MIMHFEEENLNENVLNICKRIAGPRKIVAACFYGPQVNRYAGEKKDVNVLLVIDNYRSILKGYLKPLDEVRVFIFAVDKGSFERDVKQGWLGEFVANKLITPYQPLINETYLQEKEVNVKKRIIWELLENIVLMFPELSPELLIETEYFMYEAMTQRARLFQPITYTYLNMMREDVKKKNMDCMMKGYQTALAELAKEQKIVFSDGYVKITRAFIDAIRKQKIRIPTFIKAIQRAALMNILSVLPKMMKPYMNDQETLLQTHGNEYEEARDPVSQLEDPRKHLFVPTPLGPVSFSDKVTIEDFVRKTVPSGEILKIEVKPIGGVLNDVYLLTLERKHELQKIVVKKFRDWSSIKWFSLALWSLGTKSFAVLGRTRLEREYAINQFLYSKGVCVPKTLYVSPQERLIFKEFIEGENFGEIVKEILSGKRKPSEEVDLIKEIGKKVAKIHGIGVSLGDCKPENILVTTDEKMCFVDLEQATRDGDQSWDIAEFLYYSGHYAPPVSTPDAAELVTKKFIEGYLEAGGKKETIEKAGSAKYTKVFSIFTLPHIIFAISNLCKKMGKNK
jgi:tRNA A-37 threonylcarbamoyl transferase component Bud32